MLIIKILHIALATVAIVHCLFKKEQPFWFFVILFIPVLGPLIYLFYQYTTLEPLNNLLKTFKKGAQNQQEPPIDLNIIQTQFNNQQYSSIIVILDKAADKKGPKLDQDLRYFLARSYFESKQYRNALDQFRLLYNIDNFAQKNEVIYHLAESHFHLENSLEAKKLYEAFLAIFADDPNMFNDQSSFRIKHVQSRLEEINKIINL